MKKLLIQFLMVCVVTIVMTLINQAVKHFTGEDFTFTSGYFTGAIAMLIFTK